MNEPTRPDSKQSETSRPTSATDKRVEDPVRPANPALAAELSELLTVVDPTSVVNVILQRGFSHHATDIHLDPTAAGVRIRFRIDGALQDIIPVPHSRAQHLMSRIKVLAGMDITDKRLPQDGTISADQLSGTTRDVRVGSSLTIHGERLVLRLMPDSTNLTQPESLGINPEQLKTVNEFLSAPYGLLLVVGPVGSGKTTTVYSLLSQLNRPDRSVVTIEDPVERRIHGANQIQVDPKSGLLFSTALRGVLRQDPDVICIGEIRDAETAQIACRAATTGVLVLSTLHANNTASAVDVLRHFGVSSMTIADCLRGVIAQRLVRLIDTDASEEYDADDNERRLLGVAANEPLKLARGIGREANFHTGFKGRTACFETLPITPELRAAINSGQPAFAIRDQAVADGMTTLEESARQLVLAKATSSGELARVMNDLKMFESVGEPRTVAQAMSDATV